MPSKTCSSLLFAAMQGQTSAAAGSSGAAHRVCSAVQLSPPHPRPIRSAAAGPSGRLHAAAQPAGNGARGAVFAAASCSGAAQDPPPANEAGPPPAADGGLTAAKLAAVVVSRLVQPIFVFLGYQLGVWVLSADLAALLAALAELRPAAAGSRERAHRQQGGGECGPFAQVPWGIVLIASALADVVFNIQSSDDAIKLRG